MDLSSFQHTLDKLRSLTCLDRQPYWLSYPGDLPIAQAIDPQSWTSWTPVTLNHKHHVAWEQGTVLWLAQTLVIPKQLQDYPLEQLCLRWSIMWWAELAQIFVNGEWVQEGDLFDCATRILLHPEVAPGMVFNLAVRLVSPGHDRGAMVRSLALFEGTPESDPRFIADELECLSIYGNHQPEFLQSLQEATETLDWSQVSTRRGCDRQLRALREHLSTLKLPPRPQIFLLGHAHLDLAWLWPIAETWEAAQRTFSSVLQLQEEFPELTFGHSTPALYEWIERHRPDLFTAIQHQVKKGRWEIIAGLWVEPELNLVSGESIIRQVLYGQRYIQEKFGILNRVAWLPDTFGFCWQLPQILKLGKIDYFVTQKLRWNDTTQFPYEVFWWEGLDGSQIFSLMSAPIGQGIDPVAFTRYSMEWKEKTGNSEILGLPGVGDHGGGPSRDMLEVGVRSQLSPFLPQLQFTTAHAYLDRLAQGNNYPLWQDELYLEFHRGCYTTHADQKQYNRQCERLLYQAEIWSSCASLLGNFSYPQSELEQTWKSVLFNQFHDILPGSSIPEVFAEANQEWKKVIASTDKIIEQALTAISSHLAPPQIPHANAQPILIFNPLNWQRSDIVTIPLQDNIHSWKIWTSDADELATQYHNNSLVFLAPDIPSVGYRLFWLIPTSEPVDYPAFPTNFVLENHALRVQIDPETGDILELCDRQNNRTIFNRLGNQLQGFQDSQQYWDAWNIDPNYHQHPLPPTQLKSIAWTSYGQLIQQIKVVRQLGTSEFTQHYTLFADKNQLDITTHVDWKERHTIVKVAFPLTLQSEYTTYEIPCGAIRRPNIFLTEEDRAKWEVPALNWADLTDESENYGVSLLTDYKSGYDPNPNQLRLTLLKGATWPDREADLGYHQFSYALYPHAQNWQSAGTVQRGYEFNCPLQVRQLKLSDFPITGTLPETHSFLELSHLILTAFKPSEKRDRTWIIRAYEAQGNNTPLKLNNSLGLTLKSQVNLLEEYLSELQLEIEPWQIVTFKLSSNIVDSNNSEMFCDN